MPDVASAVGGSDNDTLTGAPGGHGTLNGGPGDDVLRPGRGGASTLIGGSGRDMADYSSRTRSVSVSLDGLAHSGEADEGDPVAAGGESPPAGAGPDAV